MQPDMMKACELANKIVAIDTHARAYVDPDALLLSTTLLAVVAEVERMRIAVGMVAASVEGAIDRVEHHRKRQLSGGQQVGTGGEFASVPPSGLIAMRRYVNELKKLTHSPSEDAK